MQIKGLLTKGRKTKIYKYAKIIHQNPNQGFLDDFIIELDYFCN